MLPLLIFTFTELVLGSLIDLANSQGHEISNVESLYEFSEMARVPTHMSFGKHKGEAIADLAALLAFFLGAFGVHKFYLGQVGMGIIYLLFCWAFIPAIISFIEFIVLLLMSDIEFNRKHGGL